MKKFLMLVAFAAAMFTSAPAFAQFCNNANCMQNLQERYDPAYQGAIASPRYHEVYGYGASSYGYNPYSYGVPTVGYGQQASTCIQAIIINYCSSHPERPQVGQTCADAAGHMFAMDANKRWYYIAGSTGASMNVGGVLTRCPFSTYEATAAAPAPVVNAPVTSASVAAVTAKPSTITFRDGNCVYTVTTDADGTQHVTKQTVSQ